MEQVSLWITAADGDLQGFFEDARRPVGRLGGTPGPVLQAYIAGAGVAMSEETAGDAEAEPTPRSLAGKANWRIDGARPAGRGYCSGAEVAGLIEGTTDEWVS